MAGNIAAGDGGTRPGAGGSTPENASTGELVARLSEEVSHLVRSELKLAQTEMSEKAKGAGAGAGLLGAAGIVALYGVGTLIACAVLALALIMDAWLAALITAVVLLLVAGATALIGRRRIARATPPLPERTVQSVKRDIETIKEAGGHDDRA